MFLMKNQYLIGLSKLRYIKINILLDSHSPLCSKFSKGIFHPPTSQRDEEEMMFKNVKERENFILRLKIQLLASKGEKKSFFIVVMIWAIFLSLHRKVTAHKIKRFLMTTKEKHQKALEVFLANLWNFLILLYRHV